MKVLIFATHPIQYQVPIYRELSKYINLKVIYLLKQTKKGQADAGFGVEFEWDVPLFEGYKFEYLTNLSKHPSSSKMDGIILDKKEITSLFKHEKPDVAIIHGWFPKGMKQLINYCYKNNIKTICRGDSTLLMTSNPLKKVIKEIYIRTILKKINAYLYVGEENKKYYQHYGVKEKKLYPGLHCINTPFFSHQFNKPADNSTTINIGFAGKFIDIKQPLLLLKAINKSKFKSSIKPIFIGDGPLKKDLEEFSQSNNIQIQFAGFLNQTEIVNKGYNLIDLLILPSKSETWGLVINEVMTGGIPCIVSDTVGCHTDLIEEGRTGYTFKSGDVKELTEKIEAFISAKQEGKDFRTAVLAKIENYSLENTVKGYLKAIENVK